MESFQKKFDRTRKFETFVAKDDGFFSQDSRIPKLMKIKTGSYEDLDPFDIGSLSDDKKKRVRQKLIKGINSELVNNL